MTWLCTDCTTRNRWWLNHCEMCGEPVRGFDRKPEPEEDWLRVIREGVDRFRKELENQRPIQKPWNDCWCPTYSTCNNIACPRRIHFA